LNDQKYVEWQNFLNYLQGKGNNETETLMQDAAPDVTEFWKYSLYHIRKNWKHLWAAKYAIGSLLREIGG
jgi:hypothetical protein